eukprot:8372320-Ditylum_brightwellii.AAC.1
MPDLRTADSEGKGADETERDSSRDVKQLIDGANKKEKKYIIDMDNYFTLLKACKMLRDEGIGLIGTARFHGNWSLSNTKDTNELQWTSLAHWACILGNYIACNHGGCKMFEKDIKSSTIIQRTS